MIQVSIIYKGFPLNIKTDKMKANGWKKVFHAHSVPKKVGVALLMSDRLVFKRKVFPEVNMDTSEW